MRNSYQISLAAIALTLFSGATIAAEAVDPDTLPSVECSSLSFSSAFLQKYPNAPSACREARIYQGVTYMKVKAKVYIKKAPMLSFDLLDTAGNTLGTVLVHQPQSLRVLIDGKAIDAFELRRGEPLTIWVPESIFTAQTVAPIRKAAARGLFAAAW